MSVTPEQLLTMMAESMNKLQTAVAALADSQAKAVGREHGRKLVDLKFQSLPQYSGGSGFEDWAFAFKRTIRAANTLGYDLLTKSEEFPGPKVDMDELDITFPNTQIDKYSAELYDIICQAVSGEALQVVRSVDDMEGLDAWNKLHRKYSPKTMARAVRLVGQVTNPAKITDLTKAESQLDKWEEHVKTLSKEFKENFSDTVKVGIVTSMMPASVQEMVYQMVGNKVVYDEVVQKVRAVISNKVAMSCGGLAPMDVGEVSGKENHDYEEYEKYYDEVGAVSPNTQCFGCGGWGHLGRDCPTAKGKGKNGKGFGEGFGKDIGKGYKGFNKGGKDYGKGGKDSGKGFRGTCFTCGKTGHRAADCYARHANMVEDGTNNGEEEQEVGGLWTIGAVDADWEKPKRTVKPPPGLEKGAAKKDKKKAKNPFDVLGNNSEDIEVMAVDPAKPLTRMSSIEFNVADVRKPLASAARMVKSGNRIVLDDEGSYILNKATGETMEVKTHKDMFVFDVQFESGQLDTITLDSGAGVHVWPKDKLPEVPLMPRKDNLRMLAANGSEIKNYGRKLIKFRGNDFGKKRAEDLVFSGRV